MHKPSLFPNPPQWIVSPFPRRSPCLRPPRRDLLPPLILARPWLKEVRGVGETVAMTVTRRSGNTTPPALTAGERRVSRIQALLNASRCISLPPSLPLSLSLSLPPSLSGFNLREEMMEVKTVLEGDGEDGTKCHTLHRRYQALVREYKRMERRLVECQKKQLEVCVP